MPRPRRDSEILPAKERMENTFWDILAQREYRKITVTDIVKEAEVNRNSFYYHFSDLSELADSAILHEVERIPLVNMLETTQERDILSILDTKIDEVSEVKQRWRRRAMIALSDPAQQQRFQRIALVAGPHGSQELTDSLRDFSRLSLFAAMKLDPENVTLRTDLMVDFTVGGMIAILRRWPEIQDRGSLDTLFDDDLTALAMGIYLSMSQNDILGYWNRVFRDTHGIAN